MPREPVTVVVRYQAQPGRQDLARQELSRLVSVVVTEESECLGITLCQDATDPTRFMLYERWADRAVYLGPHMQTPHLRAFIERAPAFLSGPPDITIWREVSEASSPEVGERRR